MDALKARLDWEKKLARCEAQRFCTDRPQVNNIPWPRASNVRYPLADMIIDQKKPFKYKVLFSGEHVAKFRALKRSHTEYALGCEGFYDFHIKERTNFERTMQYCLDSGEQEGESLVKIMYDRKLHALYFQWVENLFLITPAGAQELDDAPWFIHVLQLSPDDVKKRFKDVQGIDEFVARISSSEKQALLNDTYGKEENRYERQGITESEKDKYVVLWELHYKDEDGKRRIKTIAPEDYRFDFGDDRAYPYWDPSEKEDWGWMVKQYRREITTPEMHSSRGVPEMVQEFEHVLTRGWQTRQNWMTLSTCPTVSASGGTTGSTQNLTWSPGKFYPFKVEIGQHPSPPPELMEEMIFTRGIAERRAATPDFGIGRGNTQSNSRTKYEVQQLSNIQMLSVDLETGNFKSFIREVLRYGWRLLTQYKPKALLYYMGEELTELPPEAIEDAYQITASGSAESVDKEFMLQKRLALLQLAVSLQIQSANIDELWKDVLEVASPGQVYRLYQPSQAVQANALKRAESDLSIIVSLGAPVTAQPGDNFAVSAQTGLQFLAAAAQRGDQLTPQQVNLITMYIQSHREALKKTNRMAYEQLNEALNKLDLSNMQPGAPVPMNPQANAAPNPVQPQAIAA